MKSNFRWLLAHRVQAVEWKRQIPERGTTNIDCAIDSNLEGLTSASLLIPIT